MTEAGVVKQAAEGGGADGAFADVFVAIKFGAHGGFGVVAVPDADVVEAYGSGDLGGGGFVAFG